MHREKTKIYMYGKHALIEALEYAPRVVKKVFLSHEAAQDPELRRLLDKRNLPRTMLKNSREASRMVGEDAAHQGVIAIADGGAIMVDFDKGADFEHPTENTMLVLLDELTDPHNVGAIIRSAAGFSAAGVLIPVHNQAPITGAVIKASAGMVFRVPIIAIGNVNYAIDTLKESGFRAYGLAMNGTRSVSEERFNAPTLFIVGNEGKGIREKTLERCDVTLRIPMHPRTESLNASVSAAVMLYAWSAQHGEALKGSVMISHS